MKSLKCGLGIALLILIGPANANGPGRSQGCGTRYAG